MNLMTFIYFISISFFFLCSCVFSFASEKDDLGSAPTSEFIATKYSADCGGVDADLQKDMPPVDHQQQSRWCSTFGAKALIDYHIHSSHPEDHYENRISTIDLDSWDSSNMEGYRGQVPNYMEETSPLSVLEGAQDPGELYLERDFPLDHGFFDKRGLIGKLWDYYDHQKPYADSSVIECQDKSCDSLDLEAKFPSLLQELAIAKDKTSFLSSIEVKYSLLSKPRPGASRVPISPPFNIRVVEAVTADQLIEEIQQNLLKQRPTGVEVCGNRLIQIPGLDPLNFTSLQKKEDCGGHFLIVIGMKTLDGKCKVHLRNSWGERWPEPKGDGNAWLPVDDFLKILLMQGSRKTTAISISKREPGTAVTNQIIGTDLQMSGKTFRGRLQSGKIILKNGALLEGVFRNQDQSLLEGAVINPDGTTLVGTFENSRLKKGRVATKDGQFWAGSFDDQSRLKSGYVKALLDPAKKIYYEGPFLNGLPTTAGKFTDQEGHSVVNQEAYSP